MQCPVALNIKGNSLKPWICRSLAHELHALSPQIAYWDELPHTLWVEASQAPTQNLSTPELVTRLINHLDQLDYDSSAVWGCSPYAAALLAQRVPSGRFMMIKPNEQHGTVDALPIHILDLGSEAEQSLNRLGIHSLKDLKKLPRYALESRYGKALRVRLKMLSGQPPKWQVIKPQKITTKCLIIDDEITHLESLLFLTKSTIEHGFLELANQGLACHELILSARTQNTNILKWSVHPSRSSLSAHWLIELLRLKLENTTLCSPIKEAWVELKIQPATHQQLRLFKSSTRDPKLSDEALDRLRAEFGDNLIFTARTQPRHHPKDAGVWIAHRGRWPCGRSVEKKKSWVRRFLQTPLRIAPPQQGSPWFVCGELAIDIGGPYPIEQGWWDTKTNENEYLIRVQSGRVLWVLCDPQTNLWRVIGWVA